MADGLSLWHGDRHHSLLAQRRRRRRAADNGGAALEVRSARAQNSLEKGGRHGWLFWQPKWAAGTMKLPPSPQPRRALSLVHSFCRQGQSRVDSSVGRNACVLHSTGFRSVFARRPTFARHPGRDARFGNFAWCFFFCQFGSVYPTLMILLLCIDFILLPGNTPAKKITPKHP